MRITRHPQNFGQALWCFAHTLWIGKRFCWSSAQHPLVLYLQTKCSLRLWRLTAFLICLGNLPTAFGAGVAEDLSSSNSMHLVPKLALS